MLLKTVLLFSLLVGVVTTVPVQAEDNVAKDPAPLLRVNRRDYEVLAALTPCAGNAWCADAHDYQVLGDADFFIAGRTGIRFTNKLLSYLSLVSLLSYDNTAISTFWQIRNSLTQSPTKSAWNSWAIQAGLGLKFRLSEWFLRTSVFVEPSVQGGFSQTRLPVVEKVNAFRLLPMLAVGTDTVFDNGLLLSARLAVAVPLDFPASYTGVNWQLSPSLGLGYAW